MSIIIKSGDSSNLASVNSNNDLQVAIGLTVSENSGFVSITAESDSGSVTGTRLVKNLECTDDFRLRVGTDQTFFNEYFPGTTVNGNIWNTLVSTMTITQASNFVILNGGSSVASGAFAQLRTWRHMPAFMSFPVYCEIDLQFSIAPQNNNIVEWGLGLAATTAAPTDGAFFRVLSSTDFRCVISSAGNETTSVNLINYLPDPATTNDYLIVLSEKACEFWINDVLVAILTRISNAGATTASMNLPLFIRNYNSAANSSAQIVRVGYVNVSQGDMTTNKPWAQVMAGAGNMAYQAQTGAATLGSTANLGNGTPAASPGAAMTNTTAALGSGLGGQFAAQPTLAAGTDGIVSSYQVPIGSATVPGKSLYITGVRVQGAVTTTLTGGPVLYAYSLAYGHTAVSLATVEANGTAKAPRRIALGFETFATTAAAGVIGSGVYMDFSSPIVVQPGEFIQLVAKNLGTVTSGGVINFLVTFDAFFE